MTDIVQGQLKDLSGLRFDALTESHDDPALAPMLDRVMRRVEQPGTSISGYNGAGGLSGDVEVDVNSTH
ncbi:hypothetical protein [Phytohabitans rumicis]|uniref:FXSXX-COOH protein n=1 Tax=Phytohabitans rumicis TaxID=1076125 RepID=A0A6V8KWK8_9ACTN|nr:hypothetical protein [Phytohabitans rumicis]GFJ89473.1 hypothetical protein Prum_031150 [Phytohabitans rumicis]